jgi:hypothetical protein
MMFGSTEFEHRHEPVISRRRFLRRILIAFALWCVLTAFGLAIGIAGYVGFEGMSPVDAYVNAAMILSGMGPLGQLHTSADRRLFFDGQWSRFVACHANDSVSAQY